MTGVSVDEHLISVRRTAAALRERGDLDAARGVLAPAVDRAVAGLGAGHPDVLDAVRLLAEIEYDRGDPRAARRLIEEALAAGQVPLGAAHPLMLVLAARVGEIADELGNRHEARRNFTTVAALGRTVLAPDDPALLAADRWLAADARHRPDAVGVYDVANPPAVGVDEPPVRVDELPVAADELPSTVESSSDLEPSSGVDEPVGFDEPLVTVDEEQPGWVDESSVPSGPTTDDPPEWPAVPPDWSYVRPDRSPDAPVPEGLPTVPIAPGVVALPGAAPADPASADPPDDPDTVTVGAAPAAGTPPADTGADRPDHRLARRVDADTTIQRAAEARDAHRRSRTPVIALAVVTGVAALTAAVMVLIAFLTTPTRPMPSAEPTPSTTSTRPAAPTGLTLRDSGGSVTLTWSDPTDGRVPFAIAAGRAGENSRAFQSVPPGTTRYTVNGLNPTVDYCFTVVAVYSTDQVATSELVCTDRPHPTPTR